MYHCLKVQNSLVANEYLRPREIWRVMSTGIRYLVTKGFTQKEGINYKETFSLISLKDSFRTVMALIVNFGLELHQMDVKTTFFNGNIDRTIYLSKPENFVSRNAKQIVCRLKKSI